MKTKVLAVLVLSVAVILGAAVGRAGARTSSVTTLQADLTLKRHVPQAGHPHVDGLFGGLDATYNSVRATFVYKLAWRGLRGSVIRVRIRSWSTGRTYAVLCAPCKPKTDRQSLPVSRIHGVAVLDRDFGYLIAHGRPSVEVDTTAYPRGEISGPIYVPQPPQPGVPTETPRCC